MSEIIGGNLGPDEKFDINYANGSLNVTVSGTIGPVSNSVTVGIGVGAVLDELQKAIPNVLVDEIIAAAKAALGVS